MADTLPKRDSMDATVPDLSSKLASTQLEAVGKKSPPPSFTSLPLSIRKSIYAHLLDTELVNLTLPNVSYTHSLTKDGMLHFRASRLPFPITTSLFYLNKQISREALHYFYSKNLFIRLEVYTQDARHAKSMLEDSGLLFSAASPETVAKSTGHAMDLTIVEKNSSQKRSCVLFPAQYLPRLINFLEQASKTTATWASSRALFINVLNTYDFGVAKLQGDLLELFRLLTNFGAVTIDSKGLLPGYAERLQENMMAASFEASDFLDTVTAMADRAEEAQKAGDGKLAAQHARSGIIALTYGFLTRAELLHSQPEEFVRKIQRLRWRLELCVGKSLAVLHESVTKSKDWLTSSKFPHEKRQEVAEDILAAETAVSQALSLTTDSPSPNSNPWFQSLPAELIPPNKADWFSDEERGESWYWCGIVHIVLGEDLFAAGDLERACGLCPDGKGYNEAFDLARESINWTARPGTRLERAIRLVRG